MDLNLYHDLENPENNIITNPIHLFLQEIELAVKIGPNEIWGFRYNIDLQKYIFNQYITLKQIEQEISSFISKNCSMAGEFVFTVSTELLDVEGTKVVYIKVEIQNPDSDNPEDTYTHKFILGL